MLIGRTISMESVFNVMNPHRLTAAKKSAKPQHINLNSLSQLTYLVVCNLLSLHGCEWLVDRRPAFHSYSNWQSVVIP